MARLGKGRKKVPMSKIENSNNLQVTFSKRRNGLFKKANELAVMTGAEVGIIVFSPGNRPYSFGQPDITDTINKYVGENPPPPSIAEKIAQIHRKVDVKVLNTQLNFLEDQLASALELKRKLDDETKILEKQLGIIPMKEMNMTQATMMLQALQELSLKVKNYGTANMPPKSN